MNLEEKAAVVEAILFSSGEPVDCARICEAAGILKSEALEAVEFLREKYSGKSSGIELLKLNNSFQLAAKKEYSGVIKSALEIKKNSALSPAAMETLTIIAYNQPVTKSFVEHIRGVDSSGVVNSLVEKGLLVEAGRLDLPGRPIAYKTTDNFLRSFQLSSLDDLPPLPEENTQITLDDIEQAAEDTENTDN